MPTKTGAGGEPQEYDKSTGQFGNGSGASEKTNTDKERKFENLARKVEGRAPLPEPNGITEIRKPTKFRDAMVAAKESVAPEARWRVDVHTADEYDKDRMYLSTGGSCVAIEPNGNIISVCKRDGDIIHGSDLLRHAIENGGDRLDAFGRNLYRFYTRYGFEPISWTPFNADYAPEGWKPEYGAEPVIFYKYTGKQTEVSYEEFLSNTKPYEGESGYEQAQKFRDNNM